MTVVLSVQAQSSPYLVFWSIMIPLIGHMILVAMETILAGKYVTTVTKMGMLLNWLAQEEYTVVHHWKAEWMILHSNGVWVFFYVY